MLTFRAKSWRLTQAHPETGAALVEFSLAFPLFLALFFGIFELGSLLTNKQQFEEALKSTAHYLSTRTGSYALDSEGREVRKTCEEIAYTHMKEALDTAGLDGFSPANLSGRYLPDSRTGVEPGAFQLTATYPRGCTFCRYIAGNSPMLRSTTSTVLEFPTACENEEW
jgi:hypothetical protein